MTHQEFYDWKKEIRKMFVNKYKGNTGLEVDDLEEPKKEFPPYDNPYTVMRAIENNSRFVGEVKVIIILPKNIN